MRHFTLRQYFLFLDYFSNLVEVFKSVPQGQRKVIFSTNIAETSLTIKNIRFVVDAGLAKKRNFDPNSGIEVLR